MLYKAKMLGHSGVQKVFYLRGHLHSLLIMLNSRCTTFKQLNMPRTYQLFIAVDNDIQLGDFLLQRRGLRVGMSCWHVVQECRQEDKNESQKHKEKHTNTQWTDMHDLSRPHRRRHSNTCPLLLEMVHDRNNKTNQKKKMYIVPARIII